MTAPDPRRLVRVDLDEGSIITVGRPGVHHEEDVPPEHNERGHRA